MKKTKFKLSPICAAAFAIILLVLRTVQLNVGVEYPSGLYLPDGGVINVIYTLVMIIAAVALSYTTFFDCKLSRGRLPAELSTKGSLVFGIAVIIYGSSMASYALAQMSVNFDFYGIFCMIGAISAVGLGIIITANGGIRPMCCIPVAVIIISFIIKCIFYYVSNPIITGIPQKLMVMMIYVLTVLFWINAGRLFSGGEKKLTLTAMVASGLALGCAWLAYVGSSFLLMLTDGEKWILLDDTPDIELIVIGVIPMVLSLVLLFSKKRNAESEISPEKPPISNEPKQPEPIQTENNESCSSEPEHSEPVPQPEEKESDKYDIDSIINQYIKK